MTRRIVFHANNGAWTLVVFLALMAISAASMIGYLYHHAGAHNRMWSSVTVSDASVVFVMGPTMKTLASEYKYENVAIGIYDVSVPVAYFIGVILFAAFVSVLLIAMLKHRHQPNDC